MSHWTPVEGSGMIPQVLSRGVSPRGSPLKPEKDMVGAVGFESALQRSFNNFVQHFVTSEFYIGVREHCLRLRPES